MELVKNEINVNKSALKNKGKRSIAHGTYKLKGERNGKVIIDYDNNRIDIVLLNNKGEAAFVVVFDAQIVDVLGGEDKNE